MRTTFPIRSSISEFERGFRLDPDGSLETRVREIVDVVRFEGEPALRSFAEQYDGLDTGDRLTLGKADMKRAFDSLRVAEQEVLKSVAGRVQSFAQAQMACLSDLDVAVPGGRAGHRIRAVERAGCYAPGGRYPLPSSVLMTVIPARVAGVKEVWVASPNPSEITLAAAWVAGADGVLSAGGAQAIAALAYGSGSVPKADVVVGPGNRYVTMAKKLISGEVRIDMLAGPSELVIIADGAADAGLIAADLLAQAEHDESAVPVLIATDRGLISRVERELNDQLETLPTAATARQALRNGGSILASGLDEAIEWCDRLAPEHVEVCHRRADEIAGRLQHFGAVFIGAGSAEVFGDYGIGPNHVLPTNQGARSAAGLSVFTFLRIQTWLRQTTADPDVIADSSALARLEGLEGHARAAERRYKCPEN